MTKSRATVLGADYRAAEPSRVGGRMVLSLIRHDVGMFLGVVVLAIFAAAAVTAPWIAPYDVQAIELTDRHIPPVWAGAEGSSWSHVFGTDALGRDVLSSMIYGAQTSFTIAVSVVVLSCTVGTVLGLVAGFRRGWVEALIMRTADAQVAFPAILLVALLAGAFGGGLLVVVIALTVFGWMVYARLVRSIVLKQRESGYVVAAEMTGCGPARIMRRHLLPNLRGPLLTQALLEFAAVVLTEATVSYLGFGIQPPETSWGLMISENQEYLSTAWWCVAMPGLALAMTVLAVNLVGSAIRARFNPNMPVAAKARGGRVPMSYGRAS